MTKNNLQPGVCQKHSLSATRSALLHAYQIKLLLRRARIEEISHQKTLCLTRSLDVLDAFCSWLERLGIDEEIASGEIIASGIDAEELVTAGGLQ